MGTGGHRGGTGGTAGEPSPSIARAEELQGRSICSERSGNGKHVTTCVTGAGPVVCRVVRGGFRRRGVVGY